MALITLPSPIEFPNFGFVLLSDSNIVFLNGDGDKHSCVFDIPISGTLTQIAFGVCIVITGDATFSVRLEGVSAGVPSGVLYIANSNGTVAIADGDDFKIIICDINGGTGVTVTEDDMASVVFQRTALGSANLYVAYNYALNDLQQPHIAYDLSVGSYTKIAGLPHLAFKIDGVWIVPQSCMILGSARPTTVDNNGTPKQRGGIIYPQFRCRAYGAKFPLYAVAGSGLYVKLYSDPFGTPAEIASTPLIDTDDIVNDVAFSWSYRKFVNPVILNPCTQYAAVISPADAGDITVPYANCGINTLKSVYPGGQYGVYCGRDDTGVFVADDTKWAYISLLIDQLDNGGRPEFRGGNL